MIEWVASALALVYVVLAIRQNILCWPAALVSSCLYAYIFFDIRLYMEAALNLYFAAMAVYGFWQWRGTKQAEPLKVISWRWQRHALALAVVILLSAASRTLLARYTAAAMPFVDSLVSWASVFATYLVAKKVFENWHWWFVIDTVSAGLYVNRHLYSTAVLFGVYLVLVVLGRKEWQKSLSASAVHA